jgi:hypothetical protein
MTVFRGMGGSNMSVMDLYLLKKTFLINMNMLISIS